MNVLITGAGGQLGRALMARAPAEATVRGVSHEQLDIADRLAVDSVLAEFPPDVLINAAGFTRVDDAETEHEAAERANASGPAVLAGACRRLGAWLLQVSTDYVFDGAQSRPYAPAAPTNPLSVYGRTKRQGELAVERELPSQSTVLRTSWVYAAEGRNFLTTMLRLMGSRPKLSIVSDQIGAPTSVTGLAQVLWALARRKAPGLPNVPADFRAAPRWRGGNRRLPRRFREIAGDGHNSTHERGSLGALSSHDVPPNSAHRRNTTTRSQIQMPCS